MNIRRLCKSAASNDENWCEAVYVAEPPTRMVAQGKHLDDQTTGNLLNLDADEAGVSLPTETVLRAGALFLAEQGRPAMLAEVEDFLATWTGGEL